MDASQYIPAFGGFALIGVIAGFWSQIKMWITNIFGFFIVKISVDAALAIKISRYCSDNLKYISYGGGSYTGRFNFIKPLKKDSFYAVEDQELKNRIYFINKIPMILRIQPMYSNDSDHDTPSLTSAVQRNEKSNLKQRCCIYTPRKGIDIDDLIINSVEYSTKLVDDFKRFFIKKEFGYSGKNTRYLSSAEPPSQQTVGSKKFDMEDIKYSCKRVLKWSKDDIGPHIKENPLKYLYFPKQITDEIDNIKQWRNSQKWYFDKGIPWKRGILIKSSPGCGKSSLVKAIGYELDLPIISFDLKSMNNQELSLKWQDMKTNTPCIALFEDLDAIFNGRENITKSEDGVSFDCLLNVISGVDDIEGILTIITTNYPERLDPAICQVKEDGITSRPGRVDKIITLNALDRECRKQMTTNMVNIENMDKFLDETEGYTGAQLQEKCTQIALNEYWSNK